MKKRIIKLLNCFGLNIDYTQKRDWDKIVLDHMGSCRSILDIGCGEGRFISNDPQRIVGVDGNQNSVKSCQEKGYEVKLADVTKLPFLDASFDAVHCSHVIEHLLPDSARQLLSEMNRVLKKSGVFCLRAPILHREFYFNLTHVKPYYPEAVLHYIRIKKTSQTTLESIDGLYEKIELRYRRERPFLALLKIPFRPIRIVSNILYNLGITGFRKTGYMLVLKKIS